MADTGNADAMDFVQDACEKILSKPAAPSAGASGAADGAGAAGAGAGAGGGGKKKGKKGKKKGKKGIKIDVEPLRGTRDFFGADMRFQQWLYERFEAVSKICAFDRWDSPVLESTDLWLLKSEKEEILDQLYCFNDKGGREVTLRPELTPSLVRQILKQGKSLMQPCRLWAIGQCWRYEATTRGRRREHYQWNMDIVGEPSVAAEAELLSAIVLFFESVGITAEDVCLKISSRKVLQAVLEPLGVTGELFGPVCVIVDKLDKLPEEEVDRQLVELGLSAQVRETIVSTLSLTSLDALAAIVGEDSEPVKELRSLFGMLSGYGLDDWVQFDASIVRGLAYYTGVVFEGVDRRGELRAICGGGRYDRLMSTYGAKDVPMAGFGFGDCVIYELLKDKNLLPDVSPATDILVIPFDKSLKPQACGVCMTLRKDGHCVDMLMKNKVRMKWAFTYADRVNARLVVFVAPSEWEQGLVRVKDMNAPEDAEDKQVDVPLADLSAHVARLLLSPSPSPRDE